MRQIANLPTKRAELFADYLLTLGIATKLDLDESSTTIWVCNEDHLPRAREELTAFEQNPNASCYKQAHSQASAIRQREQDDEDEYLERNEQFGNKIKKIGKVSQPILTIILIGVCFLLHAIKRSDETANPVLRTLLIDSGDRVQNIVGQKDNMEWVLVPDQLFADVRAGQVWRLFTPALLHFGMIHLIVNMISLLYLGMAIESRLGLGWLLALVVGLGVFSHVAQYLLAGGLATVDGRTMLVTSSNFGGMSGTLYGLFGYIWFKGRYHPEVGLRLSRSEVNWGLIWFMLCWIGALGPIANVAHTAGLLAGILLGAMPVPRTEDLP